MMPPGQLRLFAAATPGLEPVVSSELQLLPGASAVTAVAGGVDFVGDLATLYRANLWLRAASRVLLRLGELRAVHFASLRRQVAQLPWERYAGVPMRVKVAATAHRCRLYHTGGLAERVTLGIADRGVRVLASDAAEDAPELHVLVRGESDVFTVSLDTSGELLHRRGYRLHDTGAPLRETLAAAVVQLAGWDGHTPLYDPMCGSGTLLIEAALWASGRAPGQSRDFAFQRFADYSPALWSALRAEAERAARPLPPGLLLGADLDPKAIAAAQSNAARAGVEPLLTFSVADVRSARLPAGPCGLVLCNPPYGVRLGGAQLVRLYQSLGALRQRHPDWRMAVLASDPGLLRAVGPSERSYALTNGGLRVSLNVLAPASAQRLASASVRSRRNTAGGRPPAVECNTRGAPSVPGSR